MPTQALHRSKHYRLEVGEDNRAPAQMIEFSANGAESALYAAQLHGSGQRVAVFENGRPLASLRLSAEHGFWIVEPGGRLPERPENQLTQVRARLPYPRH